MKKCVNFVVLAVLYISVPICYVSCKNVEVDLSNYWPNSPTINVFQKYITLSEDVTTVNILNINDDVGFLIIQVHSYVENITLSYNSTLQLHSFVTGTNVGLIYGYGESSANFYIFRNVPNNQHVYDSFLLVVTVYDAMDPVPGGCNLSFANMVAPYQIVSSNEEYITVESQPPSGYGVSCDDNKIQIEMYHLFMGEYDKSINGYFEGITKMLTVENVRANGRKVPSSEGYFLYNKLFSLYRGTGEVFAILATFNDRTSAYVPAVSYGCDMRNWDGSCIGPITRYWKFICALLLILGLTICFYGHKFFKFTLFVLGFAFGVLLTYFIITLDDHFDVDEKMVTSIMIGFLYGIIWVFIWWKFGVPVLSVQLNFILSGLLVASIIFYAGLADFYIYRSNLVFWVTFVCIMVACSIIWTPMSMYSHIFGCSFLGSYAFFIALNYYLGGNLQYIVINTYRRATVWNFSNAVISPPFEIIDIMHSIGWVVLVVTGCFVQLRDQRSKPPFPPNRNGVVVANTDSERTRLIPREHVEVPQYV
ncbi:transmembrane 7 superfamily member 3-like [Anoplophora glabripennis]|uniref:transmembrane 7 superfamily member 3-like n=1 Tax=Anoplophora glabripennis TaxID=217634 RepID=UPI0008741242|nr:transmembrane 7 superfamily member 3-like [Anoplophora glabripennis]